MTNVDRTDDKPFDNSFDWLTPFKVGGTIVLIPEKLSADVETLSQGMLQALVTMRFRPVSENPTFQALSNLGLTRGIHLWLSADDMSISVFRPTDQIGSIRFAQ